MRLLESNSFDSDAFIEQLASMTEKDIFGLLENVNKTLAELGVNTSILDIAYWGWRQGGYFEYEGGPQLLKVTPTNCLNALLKLEPALNALDPKNVTKLTDAISIVALSTERLKELNIGFKWPDPLAESPLLFSKRN